MSISISDIIDKRKRRGTVEVYLEKIPEPVPTYNPSPPKRKFVELMNTHQRVKLSRKEMICLATNIYQEAKFEHYLGKMAVATITYNRVKSGRWGKDFCSVVYAKEQFSWTIFKRMREEIPKGPRWDSSLFVAKEFSRGIRVAHLDKSLFYHGDYIPKPKWAREMKTEAKIGHHIFYAEN